MTEKTVALCGAVVNERIEPGEVVRAEHHFVHAHLAMHQSILQEPEQEAVSVYATDKRFFYLRLRLVFAKAVTCDERDGTIIDEVPYQCVAALRTRQNRRVSEVIAGAAIAVFALVFGPWLMITGTLMAALGGLAILHGLVFPTRWVEVELRTPPAPDARPLTIHALRRRSGRRMLRFLREQLVL
jgi:hypothetical protein